MRVSKHQAAENRSAILRVASAQIRERGIGQLSAAEVAKAAGLTHGALYSHFASKEALVAAAIAHAFDESREAFADLTTPQLVERYLSREHRDNAAIGCPSAAVLSDMQCQPEAVRAAFNAGMARFVRLIGDSLGTDDGKGESAQALFTLAAMVGGLAIARAIREQDTAASDAVLEVVGSQLTRKAPGAIPGEGALPVSREGAPRIARRGPRGSSSHQPG